MPSKQIVVVVIVNVEIVIIIVVVVVIAIIVIIVVVMTVIVAVLGAVLALDQIADSRLNRKKAQKANQNIERRM